MDNISLSRLAACHPEMCLRGTKFVKMAEANSIDVRITQALRTWEQQDALFAQGRTAPGKIVTNASGGLSGHNFGYCVDFVPDDPNFPKFQADYNTSHSSWKVLLGLALQCGLAEGAQWRTFPDMPHLYLRELPATPTDRMRAIYRTGGLSAVYDWITQQLEVPDNHESVQIAAQGDD